MTNHAAELFNTKLEFVGDLLENSDMDIDQVKEKFVNEFGDVEDFREVLAVLID